MSHPIEEKTRERLLFVLNGTLALCGACASFFFVWFVGWEASAELVHTRETGARCVLGVFALLEVLRILLQASPWEYLRAHVIEVVLTLFVASGAFLGSGLSAWLAVRISPELDSRDLSLFFLGAAQALLLMLLYLRVLRGNRFFSARRLSPGMVLMISFALFITAGGLLLLTPRATLNGISVTDAFFTSTSAVCVTGLSTVSISGEFTRMGQWIVLALVQVGGFGVMSLTYFFAYFLGGGVSLRNRSMLQEVLSEDSVGQIRNALATIFLFTVGCEIAGVVAIYSMLEVNASGIAEASVSMSGGDRFFFSLFHSVMAFCNAGFSTLKDNLGDRAMLGREGVLGVIMVLALAGGTGFPVVKNCTAVAVSRLLRLVGLRKSRTPRLNTNSRLVLVTTIALCIGGTAFFFFTQYFSTPTSEAGAIAGNAAAGASIFPVWFSSLFYAVASRTAGFSLDTGMLAPATAVIFMFLMFVGGGPSSTAGGVKTTTLAVAILSLRRILSGKNDIEVFNRRLGDSVVHRALATILVTIAFLVLVVVALCLLHPEFPPFDLAFEAISAVCTVGLTRDITPHLCTPAKYVLIFAMFFGRVGILTTLFALYPRRDPLPYRLPEGNVAIN